MARKSRKNVGLIGLGIIGTRVAASLRSAGYHVFVWNRSPKPAPNFVGSPAEVAEICDIIQIFVADGEAVREVVEAFGDQLGPKHVIINCATIGPEATVDIAQLVQGRGAGFLDAPFTGSKGAAEKGQLVYYVGGEEEVYLRAKPVLEATSRAIVRCGGIGDASILKVATNLITAVTTQTLAEALAIVKGAGIAPEAFAAALENNACKSGVVELKLPKMVAGDYEPHFSVKHMFKDVQLGIHLANQQRLEVPLTTVVGGVLYGALCNGWGDLDFASLYRVYSDVPKPEEPIALPEQPAAETPAAGEQPAATGPIEATILSEVQAAPEEQPAGQAPESGAAPEIAAPEPKGEGMATEGEVVTKGAEADEAAKSEAEETKAEEPAPSAATEVPTATGDEADQGEKPANAEVKQEEPAGVSGVARTDEAKSEVVEGEPKSVASPAAETSSESGKSSDETSPSNSEKAPQSEEASGNAEKPAEASTNGSNDDDVAEEKGLSGFFSRVFRRRGAPVQK